MKVNEELNAIKVYQTNKIDRNKVRKEGSKIDTIESLSLRKRLNDFGVNINEKARVEKVKAIKLSIENGTYKVNSRELSRALVRYIRNMKNRY